LKLPEWKEETFEQFPEDNLSKYVPKLEPEGLDLLSSMLHMDPEKKNFCRRCIKSSLL